MTTTAYDRHVPAEGVFNFRDVGGYETQAGDRVAWRRLFRSDTLARIDPVELRERHGISLRTQIDLRGPAELEAAPSALRGMPELRYVNHSLAHESVISGLAEDWTLRDLYRTKIERRGPVITAALSELASPDAFPAVVNCTAGKDRTGIAIAFVLAVAGVSDELIAHDYALTGTFLVGDYLHVAARQVEAIGFGERGWHFVLGCEPEWMLDLFDFVRSRFGSINQYLADAGLGHDEQRAIRRNLVER